MSDKLTVIGSQLNQAVGQVLGNDKMQGFEKAYMIAEAVGKLKELLTPEYMKPIMYLQNTKLGFRTDKSEGYPEHVVRDCLIEAVLYGVQPFGNQFNIIAGNSYITKEGYGHLLLNYSGLDYKIVPHLPRIKDTSAAVVMRIEWKINGGDWQKEEIDFAIRVNKMMGADAVIGKATRKARKWLYDKLTGVESPDGDVTDIVHTDVTDKILYEDLSALFVRKMADLTKAEFDDAKRIMDNKEEESYRKLWDMLETKKDDPDGQS